MFDEKAAAHMAVYLLRKNGAPMSHLKLMKLMYLSERTSLKEYANTISGDRFVSMPHGPVLSATLNHMNGYIDSQPGGWDTFISALAEHKISVKDGAPKNGDALGHISKASRAAMDKVWEEFGAMDRYAIRDYTHEHCPEWDDPDGSSLPISIERVLCAVGYTEEQAESIAERIEEEEGIGEFFARRHVYYSSLTQKNNYH